MITKQEFEAALPRMDDDGLTWLTPILSSMIGGDPYQEGQFAVEIVEAWQAHRALPES